MALLNCISIGDIANSFSKIKGVKVYNESIGNRIIKLGLEMPGKQGELVAIINVNDDSCYLDVQKLPKVTPPCYLQINEVLARYDLQPLAPTRPEL